LRERSEIILRTVMTVLPTSRYMKQQRRQVQTVLSELSPMAMICCFLRGDNISQGERQLLAIARAMASDPEIMILDEATSNVDTHTEKKIQDAMAKLMKGRTSFVIAHRISTIIDADMILYMENRDIKEHGSHDELMALHGKYEALYNSQFT
jgi:ABC-type multidrug transport system fused ATPase/permease subunit